MPCVSVVHAATKKKFYALLPNCVIMLHSSKVQAADTAKTAHCWKAKCPGRTFWIILFAFTMLTTLETTEEDERHEERNSNEKESIIRTLLK